MGWLTGSIRDGDDLALLPAGTDFLQQLEIVRGSFDEADDQKSRASRRENRKFIDGCDAGDDFEVAVMQ